MSNLISMVDFVLVKQFPNNNQQAENESILAYDFYNEVPLYAKFLKQTLELWMFVPCGEDGEVLEEPKISCATCKKCTCSEKYHIEYQTAKERCLFEGFEVKNQNFSGKEYEVITNKDIYIFFYDTIKKEWQKVNDFKTIEDLVKYNLKLTATALKQIEAIKKAN